MQNEVELESSVVVTPDACGPSSSYGVTVVTQWRHCKGYIQREKYGSGSYHLLSADNVTLRNGWSGLRHNDLRELVKEILEAGNQVIRFDTTKELFKWLSE